jgi:2-polyprenyl-3-methyl-5-hydroxy-6-metoxy-1,4-benzoquinol methylase
VRPSEFAEYWERRAQRFATEREGLAAVCSYGMPEFYNRSIQFCQRLALARWLKIDPLPKERVKALDVGCGVGRWSRVLAVQGARVTGVDISPTMTAEAARRTQGLDCRFVVADLANFDTGERHSLVVGVTVLQHILDDDAFRSAIRNLARHLAPGGRMVLLEAAPTRRVKRCDTAIFTARGMDAYLEAFAAAGLKLDAITGVDPAPFKTWFLPYFKRLPRPFALAGLAAATALALPIDALLGRVLARASWHKVFVLSHGHDQIA